MLDRINRKLLLASENLRHAQEGFVLAAKMRDEAMMQKWREDIFRIQDEVLDLVKEVYTLLDEEFEALLEINDEIPYSIH